MSNIPQKTRDAVWERSQRFCEAQLPGCLSVAKRGQATEINHIKSRARGGSHELHNLMAVCLECHKQITDNKPGTEIFRTHRWQEEGTSEIGMCVFLRAPDGEVFGPWKP